MHRDERLVTLEQAINASRRLDKLIAAVLAEDSFREDSWRILSLLSRSHGLLMGEVASELSLPNATTTRLIDDLVDTALVFRRPSPVDGRKAMVYLSREGEARLARIDAMLAGRVEVLFDALENIRFARV
ncbi:MarR family transcriptional regulator [Arthrobacter sp. NPDC080031]|uniref:MarR family winged helix-turn-helix transcriptional regulator n=1 Tax=Arthrobacter sp. NPDC080031 TaxID=3155918 RepID=UPI003450807F